MNVSVCMATYNGARYVHEQVASILPQLGPSDELVVVDDCSRDETVSVLRALEDPRVRIHCNERNRGVVASLERALRLACNDVLMLADSVSTSFVQTPINADRSSHASHQSRCRASRAIP